ncbi:MAG: DUF2335 domain-containing protein [Bryobacterales bacterium]|nr:DUF2335 domain-containing protein [Bryobacterales bacterium]
MPGERRAQAARLRRERSLPPPDVLRGYEEVIPGGAERLLAMVER